MSEFDRLRMALDLLTDALCLPAVAHRRDEITVTLSLEAGLRFEAWAHANVPPLHMNWWSLNGIDPKRGILIDGVRFVWPVQLVAIPGAVPALRPIATFTRDIPGHAKC